MSSSMFKLFRLGCWQVTATGDRIEKTLYMNPQYVAGIEQEQGYTVVYMSFGTFYTYSAPHVIQEGLNNVAKLNRSIVMWN